MTYLSRLYLTWLLRYSLCMPFAAFHPMFTVFILQTPWLLFFTRQVLSFSLLHIHNVFLGQCTICPLQDRPSSAVCHSSKLLLHLSLTISFYFSWTHNLTLSFKIFLTFYPFLAFPYMIIPMLFTILLFLQVLIPDKMLSSSWIDIIFLLPFRRSHVFSSYRVISLLLTWWYYPTR